MDYLNRDRQVTHFEGLAANALRTTTFTQGKCQTCDRFYYFNGPLHRRRCPVDRRMLDRTSRQSTLPRFVIEDRRGGPNVISMFDLVSAAARP